MHMTNTTTATTTTGTGEEIIIRDYAKKLKLLHISPSSLLVRRAERAMNSSKRKNAIHMVIGALLPDGLLLFVTG